jgi:hypothetical protein
MITIDKKEPKQGYQEPVSLADAQIYFRNEDSGGIEDDLIMLNVAAARELLEEKLNRSLVANEIELTLDEGFSGYLPFGAVVGEVTFSQDVEIYGTKYPYVKCDKLTVATYETAPYYRTDIKMAILELAYHLYDRGGDTNYPKKVEMIVMKHTRNEIA